MARLTELIAALMLISIASIGAGAAHAGDAMICGTDGPCRTIKTPTTCTGRILTVDAWTTIGNDCTFKSRSKLGEKILDICPQGSTCSVTGAWFRDSEGWLTINKMPDQIWPGGTQ
jgi:hypothetical protein